MNNEAILLKRFITQLAHAVTIKAQFHCRTTWVICLVYCYKDTYFKVIVEIGESGEFLHKVKAGKKQEQPHKFETKLKVDQTYWKSNQTKYNYLPV